MWKQQKIDVGMKAVENGRENTQTIPVTAFLIREQESRSGIQNRLHGISKANHFDREYADNDRESIVQNRNNRPCNHFKYSAQ
jgi:hypothetical protein